MESPLNSSDRIPVAPLLKWKRSKLSETYRVQVATDTNFVRIALSDSSSSDTTKRIVGLSNITKYFWRVSSKNVGGVSLWSDVLNFKTIEPLPGIPILLSPANKSGNQDLPEKLRWEKQENMNSIK